MNNIAYALIAAALVLVISLFLNSERLRMPDEDKKSIVLFNVLLPALGVGLGMHYYMNHLQGDKLLNEPFD